MARTHFAKTTAARAKLTDAQKEARRARAQNLSKELAETHTGYQTAARNLAKKHGRSLAWTRSQLYMGGKFTRQRRAASAYNALVQKRMAEINADLAVGSKWNLRDFIKAYSDTLSEEYAKLSTRDKQALREGLTMVRDSRIKVTRANPRALCKYVDKTFDDMQKDWTAICNRSGIQGMYFAVRSSLDQFHELKVFMTAGSESFVREVLGQEPRALALRLEAWAVSKLTDEVIVKPKPKLREAISLCRKMIQEGLDKILVAAGVKSNKKKINMNYDNYEGKIVELYNVAMVGWPCGKVANPGTIGRDNVFALLEALETPLTGTTPKCHWVQLTDEQVEARKKHNTERVEKGEVVYKPRKQKKKKAVVAKSAEVIESSDESSGED